MEMKNGDERNAEEEKFNSEIWWWSGVKLAEVKWNEMK